MTGVLRLPPGAAETDAVVLPDVPADELHKDLLPIALTPEGRSLLADALRDSNNSITLAGASLTKVSEIDQQAETHMATLYRAVKTPWGISISTAIIVILTIIGLIGTFFYLRSKFSWFLVFPLGA